MHVHRQRGKVTVSQAGVLNIWIYPCQPQFVVLPVELEENAKQALESVADEALRLWLSMQKDCFKELG